MNNKIKLPSGATEIMRVHGVSRRSPHVRGAARKYYYTSTGVYIARERKKQPGTYYWEGPISTGPCRRSDRCADADLDQHIDRLSDRGYRVYQVNYHDSLRRQDATEAVLNAICDHHDPVKAWSNFMTGAVEVTE